MFLFTLNFSFVLLLLLHTSIDFCYSFPYLLYLLNQHTTEVKKNTAEIMKMYVALNLEKEEWKKKHNKYVNRKMFYKCLTFEIDCYLRNVCKFSQKIAFFFCFESFHGESSNWNWNVVYNFRRVDGNLHVKKEEATDPIDAKCYWSSFIAFLWIREIIVRIGSLFIK